MIPRTQHEASIRELLRHFPVVGLIGARQVGKTTLARAVIGGEREPVTVFDLKDPTDEAKLEDPKLALESLRGLVVERRNVAVFRPIAAGDLFRLPALQVCRRSFAQNHGSAPLANRRISIESVEQPFVETDLY